MSIYRILHSLVTRHSSLVTSRSGRSSLVAALALALVSAPAGAETVEIASASDWAAFANRVNAGEIALCAEMTADVTLGPDAPMVGSSQYFEGIFDGQGHTLTVAFEETGGWNPSDIRPCAPFAFVSGATIRNLHVTGSISSNGRYAAGFCGFVLALQATTSLSNCRSSVCIECRGDGAAESGGFVGIVAAPGELQMADCVFDGSIVSGKGVAAHSCGGFVGWRDGFNGAAVYLARCLFAPEKTTVGTDGNTATFVRDDRTDGRNLDSCRYLRALGAAQGTDASAMSAEDLAAALGSEWTVADGKVVLAAFPYSVEVYDPGWAVVSSAADWARFAERVNEGETDLNARLTADVTLGRGAPRVGTESNPWTGEFDGRGHTLRVNWTLSSTIYVAPFSVTAGCTIHDLCVAGSIVTDTKYAGGFIGWAKPGSVVFERCRSCVSLTTTVTGEACCAGFVGRTYWAISSITFRDCVFDGSILGPDATDCGGFAVNSFQDPKLYFQRCLFDPVAVSVSSAGSKTFAPSYSDHHVHIQGGTYSGYYTRTLGAAQGTDASAMSAEDLVAALGAENWCVMNGRAMLKEFISAGDPEPAVAGFVYQGALRDAQGERLAAKDHVIEFRIHQSATGGEALWGRSCPVRLDDEGLFNVALHDGAGESLAGVPSSGLAATLAANAGTTLYVGLTVAGSGAEILPRQKLLSVPFASVAADAVGASGDFTVAGRWTAGDAKINGDATAAAVHATGGASVGGHLAVVGELMGRGTVPVGGIVAWSGSAGSIPDGWALCDGRRVNGRTTPDLCDRFVVGAGGEYGVDAVGGKKTHALDLSELPNHSHSYRFRAYDLSLSWKDQRNFYAVDKGSNWESASVNSAGEGKAHENRPPYYALCYIMRVR